MTSLWTASLVVLASIAILASAQGADDSAATFTNPIIPGFHPDPSICRVGDDYYLVNSTFEYFPGVPIFHSKDLVHWRQIGNVLARKSQLNLDKMRASGGIYAPTLRYHDGTFYMVTTLVDGGGNFYVTAADPAGPWSDPVWLDAAGIDPSFLFDDDGTVYYTRHEGMGDGHIGQRTLNLTTGKLEGDLKNIWSGTGGIWPEGPHLYKINGKYYLLIAEGGTSYDHKVTVARSDSPWGPFESNPANPILTHAKLRNQPIQALGHADFVETPDGWWAVFLGIRPQGGRFHHLGRETFLAPVTWSNGWPVVNEGKPIELTMPAPQLKQQRWKLEPVRDPFGEPTPGFAWNYLRNPVEQNYSLTERKGFLRLRGSAVTMNDQNSPTFVGIRQADFACRISARLSFDPKSENEEAGLVLRGNDKFHYELGLTLKDGKRHVFLRKTLGGKTSGEVEYAEAPGKSDVQLTIEATLLDYSFSFKSGRGAAKTLGTAKTADLSSEKIGGFTGVYVGMYATGNGKMNSVPADFDWFEYQPVKEK